MVPPHNNQQVNNVNSTQDYDDKNVNSITKNFVCLQGLKIKEIEQWDLSQDSPEPLIINATFAVDIVRIMAPSGMAY